MTIKSENERTCQNESQKFEVEKNNIISENE
jgi:hypothetical protein